MADVTYSGARTIDGASVTVDGKALDERLDIKVFEARGFEWSYEGDGPRQLALAILAHHYGDDQKALDATEAFMKRVVANFGNEWEMTTADVDKAIKNIGVVA